jgi:caffeoyl-CoA O-methyltransferase
MFHDIPDVIQARMVKLQELDRAQRAGAAPPELWVLAIPPETGKLLALLAASAPEGTFVELGTGSGYSTLWLALAARARPRVPQLETFESDPAKAALALETFHCCDVSDLVSLRVCDAVPELHTLGPLAFAFVDHGPRNYEASREALLAGLATGGLLAIDNIDSHAEVTAPFVGALEADARIDCTVLHVGKGVLIARRIP